MRRKKRPAGGFVCIVLSVCVLAGTLFGADFLSEAASKALSGAVGAQSYVDSIKRESLALGDVNEKSKAEQALSGFGSGRVNGDLTDTPDDIKKLMKEAEKLYGSFKKTGDIDEVQFGASSANTVYSDIFLSNKTDSVSVNLESELSKKPSFGKITKSKPYVLIYHTHTTEGYELLSKGWYSESYNSRTKDTSKTVVRVGDEICKQLENAGYNVIHDTEIYDASYNGAYSRSLVSVEKYLKEYPSIVLTLDVHRDAIHYESGTKCKPTAVINGKKAAQVMIITGCENGNVEDFPDWNENLTFAVALQNTVQKSFPGLMRPIFFCERKYNMNVTPCSLLLEFGTDANTLEEAVYSGRIIGQSLSALLDENL